MDGNFSLQNKKATKIFNSHAYHCQYEMSQYITYEHFTCIYSKKIQAFYAFIIKGIAYPHWERN